MRASSGTDAVFTSTPTAFTQSSTTASSDARQLRLVDVVLVLADTDGLRIDLHQFGQRVLQATRDRHRATQRHVEIGEFLGGQFRRRVHRRTGFGHHDLGQLQFRHLGDQFAGQLVGLAAGGAVADGDQVDRVRSAQGRERGQRALPVAAAARAGRSSAVSSSLPVASTTATLQPVRRPGSRPIVARGPAGAASSRSCRLWAKTLIASVSARPSAASAGRLQADACSLTFQVQRTTSTSHLSAGRPAFRDAECRP